MAMILVILVESSLAFANDDGRIGWDIYKMAKPTTWELLIRREFTKRKLGIESHWCGLLGGFITIGIAPLFDVS